MSDAPGTPDGGLGETIDATTNIRVEVYDSDADALGPAAPREVMEMHNETCVGLHEYIPRLLDYQQTYQQIVDHPTKIAFGDDAASGFASSDRSLNNKVGDVALTSPEADGVTWACSELVGTLELTNENLRELGVESKSGVLWNHAAMPTPLEPKTNSDALSIDIRITFGDAP